MDNEDFRPKQVNNLIAQANQLILASSLLAGFAFTAAMGILGLKEQGVLYAWSLSFFLLSAVVLLASTCTLVFMALAAYEALPTIEFPTTWETYERKRRNLMTVGPLAFFLGLVGFLAGIGITGWLYSTIVGLLSVSAAALGLILALWAFIICTS